MVLTTSTRCGTTIATRGAGVRREGSARSPLRLLPRPHPETHAQRPLVAENLPIASSDPQGSSSRSAKRVLSLPPVETALFGLAALGRPLPDSRALRRSIGRCSVSRLQGNSGGSARLGRPRCRPDAVVRPRATNSKLPPSGATRASVAPALRTPARRHQSRCSPCSGETRTRVTAPGVAETAYSPARSAGTTSQDRKRRLRAGQSGARSTARGGCGGSSSRDRARRNATVPMNAPQVFRTRDLARQERIANVLEHRDAITKSKLASVNAGVRPPAAAPTPR
jgi:hypothetical protein